MTKPPVPLTALSEEQRAQTQSRFSIIRPALEDGVTQAPIARTNNLPRTVQRWVKRYREKGLTGLADAKVRSDKGKSRRLPASAITLIEGLALQTPLHSMAAIHRQVTTIAGEQGWNRGLPTVGTESRNRKIAQKSHGWPLSTNGPEIS
ncbi:MAG TPA: helix-turn-helix domain-containing protein [Ktedonobacteraceae bacterium]|nr:helix-turn-helix domain-containing protein [Ktedonobacteraceae bacterium]